MPDQHPITPTDKELLAAMKDAINAFPPSHPCAANMTIQQYETELQLRKGRAILARWGAARRPQPKSLAEEALEALEVEDDAWPVKSPERGERFDLIRRALEQLQELEGQQ
jgi:hypothetical protein